MKSHTGRIRNEGNELLDQLRPKNIFRDVSELLLKVEKDPVFRNYLRSRVRIVTPVVLVFVFTSTVCAIAIMFWSVHLVPPPVPFLGKLLVLLLGAAVWVGGIFAQASVFAVWLEQRAIRRNRSGGPRPAAPGGVINYLKYSRTVFPWVLVAVCVVLPLGILIDFAPIVAFLVLAAEVAAPVAYDRVDA